MKSKIILTAMLTMALIITFNTNSEARPHWNRGYGYYARPVYVPVIPPRPRVVVAVNPGYGYGGGYAYGGGYTYGNGGGYYRNNWRGRGCDRRYDNRCYNNYNRYNGGYNGGYRR